MPRANPTFGSKKQQRAYDLDLSLYELSTSLHEMVDDKAPSLHGFSYKFYKATRDFVGSYLLQVYKEALRNNFLGARINEGFNKFMPKTRDPKLITNWRPITLLNTSYKIMAKALALCIKHILSKIIHPKQTGFIPR